MSEDEEKPESVPLSDLRADVAGDEEDHPTDDSTPLSGLRDAVRDRAEESAAEEAFVEEQQEPVDTQRVWADLLGDEETEGEFAPADVESGPEGETQIIEKHICERCQYLAAPPELRCTHEGTTIHELVDVEHVRVSACPMVDAEGEKRRPE